MGRGGRSLSPSSSFFFPLSPHHRQIHCRVSPSLFFSLFLLPSLLSSLSFSFSLSLFFPPLSTHRAFHSRDTTFLFEVTDNDILIINMYLRSFMRALSFPLRKIHSIYIYTYIYLYCPFLPSKT